MSPTLTVQHALVAPCLGFDAWLQLRGALHLSEREIQVVQGIFEDRELDAIAAMLSVPVETVYRALSRVFIKLQVGSRRELIVRVMAENLALVADQAECEFSGLDYWPVKLKNSAHN